MTRIRTKFMSIKHVAIVCGGPSAEHEVSLRSALNIATAIDTSKYHLLLLGIDKQGQWFQFSDTQQLADCANKGKLSDNLTPVVLLPQGANSVLMQLNQASKTQKIDSDLSFDIKDKILKKAAYLVKTDKKEMKSKKTKSVISNERN